MNEEQTALLQKAKHSLRAAYLLHEDGLYDIAVSRAYYVMFYVASAILVGFGIHTKSHKGVIAKFAQLGNLNSDIPDHLGSWLANASNARHLSDYVPGTLVTAEESTRQITRAEAFLEAFRSMGL